MKRPDKILKIYETKNVCKKVYFGTKEAAEDHIKKLANSTNARPAQAYLCHKCNSWHITSWTAPDYKMWEEHFNKEVERVNRDLDIVFDEMQDEFNDMQRQLIDARHEIIRTRIQALKK